MLTAKRVIIATVCGLIFGLVCMCLASSNPETPISVSLKLTILFSRALMGFTIGISAIRLSWWLHGIMIGFVTSIPMALPVMDRIEIFVGTFAMGMLYGFLTELITTKAFKANAACR
jgi:hypothetical protein